MSRRLWVDTDPIKDGARELARLAPVERRARLAAARRDVLLTCH
jgi:hypothetical protein